MANYFRDIRMNKLELLYDIEGSLAVLEVEIPYGLRKSSQISRAAYCVAQLIEEEIKSQTKQGNKHIIPSYADGRYQELEVEYNAMQQAIDDWSYDANGTPIINQEEEEK